MAGITIRNLGKQTLDRLRVRAAQHKRSMEEEALHILRAAVAPKVGKSPNLAEAIRRRMAPLGGVDLQLLIRPRSKVEVVDRFKIFMRANPVANASTKSFKVKGGA